MEVNHKELLENLMHELSGINAIIKASAEALSKGTRGAMDKQAISHHSELVLSNAFLLSTQLDIVNYQLNPDFIEIEKPDKRNLYGKFHKAIISYNRIAKQKDVKILVKGSLKTLIDSYPVIDTLPILIIDNAIKYSPRNDEIEINFYEDENEIEVEVCNMGPYLTCEELEVIYDRGYRGIEAIKTDIPGHGYGMSFIKYICDIHNAFLEVNSEQNPINYGGVKYSEFSIRICIYKR